MKSFRMVWLLSYISIASFSATLITPALPIIQQHFNLVQGQIEWLVSAFLIGYVLGQLIYGPLANRFGRINALRTGLGINIVGILICLTALYFNLYSMLILGRLVSALGAASGLACTFMLVNEWLPIEQRQSAMAYTILSFTLGIGLAVIVGGIITEYSYWGYCFFILLAHGLLMLYGTKVFHETLLIAQPLKWSIILKGYRHALVSSRLVIYSIVVGYCSAIGYCFSAAGPQIAINVFQITPAAYGYWNGLNILGMLAGGFLARYLLHRNSAQYLIRCGLVGIALGLVSLLLLICFKSNSVLWFFIITSTLYLFGGLLFSGGASIASTALPDKASGAAMMSFINMITATMAVIIMGYVASNALIAFFLVLSVLWGLIVILRALIY